MILKLTSLLLIFIIMFCVFIYNKKTNNSIEGFEPLDEINKLTVLDELFTNVNNHEISLSVFSNYNDISEIKVDATNSISDNIMYLFEILMRHDDIISKLKPSYKKSKTITELKNGNYVGKTDDYETNFLYGVKRVIEYQNEFIKKIFNTAEINIKSIYGLE